MMNDNNVEIMNEQQQEIYNSWRYGDEASLYSIAEDSREDRQSEALSRAGTDHGALSTVTGGSGGDRGNNNNNNISFVTGGPTAYSSSSRNRNPWDARAVDSDSDDDETDYDDCPVEVKWVTDAEMDAALAAQAHNNNNRRYAGASSSTRGSNKRGRGSVAPNRSGRVSLSDEEDDAYVHSLGYRLNSRPHRLVIVFCLICVAIAGIVLAVFLTAEEESGSSSAGGGNRGNNGGGNNNNNNNSERGNPWDERDEPEDVLIDTLAPTPGPTVPRSSQPTPEKYEEIVTAAAQQVAHDSISACPYADVNDFYDITVPQAEVFQELILDLKAAASVDPTDESVSFEANHGMGYLLERWALLMLFFSTDGEYWERNGGWYTDSDVCEWETALRICEPRVAGEAAMTYLDLHSFGLVGTIPKEICCMPKLKKLFLYSNRLTGEIPQCLFLMGLEDLDLSNNKFTSSTQGVSLANAQILQEVEVPSP